MTPRWSLRAQRRIAAWALLAVLAVQWLALGHAVQHTSVVAAAFDDHESVAHALGGEHDAGSSLCQLLDQLLSGQGVGPVADPSPCPARDDLLAHETASVERAPASAYHARAPPLRA